MKKLIMIEYKMKKSLFAFFIIGLGGCSSGSVQDSIIDTHKPLNGYVDAVKKIEEFKRANQESYYQQDPPKLTRQERQGLMTGEKTYHEILKDRVNRNWNIY